MASARQIFFVQVFARVDKVFAKVGVMLFDRLDFALPDGVAKPTAGADEFGRDAQRIQRARKLDGARKADLTDPTAVTEKSDVEHAFTSTRHFARNSVDERGDFFDRFPIIFSENLVHPSYVRDFGLAERCVLEFWKPFFDQLNGLFDLVQIVIVTKGGLNGDGAGAAVFLNRIRDGFRVHPAAERQTAGADDGVHGNVILFGHLGELLQGDFGRKNGRNQPRVQGGVGTGHKRTKVVRLFAELGLTALNVLAQDLIDVKQVLNAFKQRNDVEFLPVFSLGVEGRALEFLDFVEGLFDAQ